jgi:hypothetical protein
VAERLRTGYELELITNCRIGEQAAANLRKWSGGYKQPSREIQQGFRAVRRGIERRSDEPYLRAQLMAIGGALRTIPPMMRT